MNYIEMKLRILLITVICFFSVDAWTQPDYQMLDSVRLAGKVYSAIVHKGDTLILAQLDDVKFTSPRSFNSRDEYRRYLKYKRYASLVYPYAVDAINILKTVEERTEDMRKRKRKKYIKQTYKQLELNFKNRLMKMTRIQGQILVKMIEKELDQPFYTIIREKRNLFTAVYWQQLGKTFGYDLKRGYHPGDDLIMDAVLRDFDVSTNRYSEGNILSK